MVAQNLSLALEIAGANKKSLVAVDAKLYLKAGFGAVAGRVRRQEGRAVLVHPELLAPLLRFGVHLRQPRGAGRVEDQLHGRSRRLAARFGNFEDRDAELGLSF